MKIIIWHKTNYLAEDEIKVYSMEGMSEKETEKFLKKLWKKEINEKGYDINKHLEDTYFEKTEARVRDYDWQIDMWIDETSAKKVL